MLIRCQVLRPHQLVNTQRAVSYPPHKHIISWSIRMQEAPVDAEVAVTPKNVRKRKTTHSDLTHGSFFLRVGAIGECVELDGKIYPGYVTHWTVRLFHSFRFGRHDLYWPGVWIVLWDTLRFAVSSHPDWRKSAAPDDLHLHADVLYIHECPGKCKGQDCVSNSKLKLKT